MESVVRLTAEVGPSVRVFPSGSPLAYVPFRERSEALGTLVDMRRVRLNYSLCRLGKLGQAATVTDDWNSVDVVLLECIARRAEEEPT